ncbi:hypothetical protein EC968_002965, partial [Mortierella alpina]
VVFFSFWQSVVIEGLVWFGLIKATTYWSTNDISVGINALLIDFEMVFFAFMHVKAFSYEPYIPKIRNPDLPPLEETMDEEGLDKEHKDDNNNNNNNNNKNNDSMASIDSSLAVSGNGTGRAQPPTKKSTKDDRKQTSKRKGKKGKKEETKDEGPPEMVMDRSQKTPLWKGLLDSFNPLDTLRELGYGFKYLYRWARGIPVDKDSRRLLDLERAFGRQRPEVPYVPPKDSEKDKKKKKKKKKKKRSGDSEEEDDDDESTSGHEDDGSENESRKGNNNNNNDNDDYDDDDDGVIVAKHPNPDRPNRRRDGDLEKGYASGAESAYTDRDHRGVGPQSKRRADVAYDMGYGYAPDTGASPRGTVRSMGVGVGGGSKGVVRKPVKPVVDTIDPSTSGRLGINAKPKSRMKKESIEYLGKEDAARTERATLPDIQPEPVTRKIALSGLYVDLPTATIKPNHQMASPASFSSLDIPVPMPYHQQHRMPFESHTSHSRNWERERERERDRDREYHIDMEMEPVRFEHRDRELERAALEPEPYVLPAPVIPRSTRPELTATPVRVMETPDSHFDDSVRGSGVLTQHPNQGFDVQEVVPKKREAASTEISHIVAKAVATAVATNAVTTQSGASAAEAYHHHQKDDSKVVAEDGKGKKVQKSQPLNHERNESAETNSAQSSLISGGQFYHHREGSRSDPELSHYGHDYEHYVRQMLLEEQEHQRRYYQQQLQGRAPPPPVESFASAPAPEPAPLTHQRVQQLQDQLQRHDEKGQQLPIPSTQYLDPGDNVDPIVAQYSQIQQRQKELEQEQQKFQQRQQDAAAPELAPEPEPEPAPEVERPPPKQRLPTEDRPSTNTLPKQPKPLLLPRRRNSLESLSSDSSGSFRFWGYANASRAAYDRDYYGYGGGYDAVYARPKASRYHRAYRYPMPLAQPVPPAQFYRFPEDRDLYEQRRQEDHLRQQQQQYYGSAAAANAATSSSSSSRIHPFLAQQRSSFYQGLQQFPRAYSNEYSRYAPPPSHAHPSMEPLAYDYGGSYDDHHRSPPPTDPRYRSPPMLPLTGRSPYDQRRMMAQQPSYGGAQPRIPPTYREERDRDRERDRMAPRDRRDLPPGTELLFPASRYAAPFLRDYEIQQREGRRRMTQSPPPPPPALSSSAAQPTLPHESVRHGRQRKESHPASGLPRAADPDGVGGHDVDDVGGPGGAYRPQQPRAHHRQRPTTAPMPAASSIPAYEDDGPYEEAIVWSRASLPAAAPTSSTGATDGS